MSQKNCDFSWYFAHLLDKFPPFGRICNPTALNISILNAKQPLLRIANPYIRGCRIANPTERGQNSLYPYRFFSDSVVFPDDGIA